MKSIAVLVAGVAALSLLTLCPAAAPAPAPPATKPAAKPDMSSPKATARTMLLAMKSNDLDAFMGCHDIPDKDVLVQAREQIRTDFALHRLVTAAMTRWGKAGFGEPQDRDDEKLPAQYLLWSDAPLDRSLSLLENGKVELKDGLATLSTNAGPDEQGVVVIDLLKFRKVGADWKVAVSAREPAEREDADAIARRREKSGMNAAVERLATEVESGKFNAPGALVRAIFEEQRKAREAAKAPAPRP